MFGASKTCSVFFFCFFLFQLQSLIEFEEKPVTDSVMEEFGVKKEESYPFHIEGFMSSCRHGNGRSAPDRQFFYINGRPCEPTKVFLHVLTRDVHVEIVIFPYSIFVRQIFRCFNVTRNLGI